MAETALDLNRVNIPSVVAGVLTLVLPFLGAWWSLTLGTDAIVVTTGTIENSSENTLILWQPNSCNSRHSLPFVISWC